MVMKLYLDRNPPIGIQSECLVIGVTEGGPLTPAAAASDEASGGAISRMLESGDIDTGLGKTNFLHGLTGLAASRILAVGFGKQEKLELARFDRGCLAAGKALRDHPLVNCHVCVHELEFGEIEIANRL
jgi:leucyl aminopeptidase